MHRNKISYKFCLNSDIENVIQAIKDWVNKDHILSKSRSLFDFQHKLKDGYSFIIAKQKDKLVGILGFIPTYLYDSSLEKDLQYSTVTWFVDLKTNISGLGMTMFRNLLIKKKASFCYALSISEKAFLMHELLGYKIGWMFHAFIVNPSLKKIKIIKNTLHVKKLNQNKNYSLKQIKIKSFDQETAQLKIPLNIVPTKSANYFKNRYLKHPIYNYNVYGIYKGSSLQALIALRLISIKDTKVIRLVDFVGIEKSLASIAFELQNLLLIEKAEYIDLYFFGLDNKILENGGFTIRTKNDNTIIPNYFEPFVNSNVEINFAYHFMNSNDDRSIHLFKGDADQDRPNIILKD